MSKILQTLRRAALVPSPSQAPAADGEPEFIEIGPGRQVIAASPSVLASPARPAAPQFRAVPAAAPVFRRPRLAPELVAYHAPDGPVAGGYAALFASIREAAAVKAAAERPVLLFAPVRPEIGSTTVLLNVAVVAARQGRRTLVVDANLKRPAVAARLGLSPAPGLAEVLAGECPADDAIRATDQEGLFALTAGESGPLLADVRSLHELLGGVRGRFDLILVDGPRWDGRAAGAALAAGCDAVFVVVPAGEADGPPASEWARDLPRQGVRLAGSILTAR